MKFNHKARKVIYDDEPECSVCGVQMIGDRHVGETEPEAVATPLPTIDAPIVAGTSNTMGDRAILRGLSRIGTLRWHVVEAVQRRPMTDDELEVALSRTHQSVSACTNRLRADGWLVALVADGEQVTRKTRSGNDATVWTLSPAATRRFGDAPRVALSTGH